jgi:hypothetical protein
MWGKWELTSISKYSRPQSYYSGQICISELRDLTSKEKKWRETDLDALLAPFVHLLLRIINIDVSNPYRSKHLIRKQGEISLKIHLIPHSNEIISDIK